ncbi:MAG: hypothetical protein ABJE47_19840 [bacterium]
MIRPLVVLLLGAASVMVPCAARAQAKRFPLNTTDALRVHNTAVDAETFKGERAVRVTIAPEFARRPDYLAGKTEPDAFARLDGLTFSNGVIEVEVASAPAEGASAGARGFAGIAFRVQTARDPAGPQAYDAFYLRPTNGRAADQERRNHATQYISHPDWTWSRFRQETPSRYEAYVDLMPDTWTKLRIEVHGAQAKLFVHGQSQPTLIVNDVKSGPSASGGVALWIGPGTIAHFRNLVITPE